MRNHPRWMDAAAAMLGICMVSANVLGCHKAKPAPSINDLTEALQRSADQAIAAPSLVDSQIVVPQRTGQLDAQTKEIEQIFSDAGGSAVVSLNAAGQTSIFGTIPAINLAAFKSRLNHQKATMTPGPESPACTVEVLIDTPHPSPSPTP